MVYYKAYKFRMYPTNEQAQTLEQWFGTCRYVYNWALEQRINYYQEHEKTLSKKEIQRLLYHVLKPDPNHEFLKQTPAMALQWSLEHMDTAFKNFFKHDNRFPRFKSRKNPVQSFSTHQGYKVDTDNGYVKLPKMDWIRTVIHQPIHGKMKTVTVSRNPAGKYYISIRVEIDEELPEKQSYEDKSTIGIDLGIKHFAILSDGTKVENPRYLINAETRLKVLQQRLSRKQKGSENWKKAKKKVARLHEHIKNQREDFLHNLSKKLISENQAIAVEDLNVKGLVKNDKLAKHISDVGWSKFIRMLDYKCDWYGKNLITIHRFTPSSKLCSVCGYKNDELELKDRYWTCPVCSTEHDRDLNASYNIKKEALTQPYTAAQVG